MADPRNTDSTSLDNPSVGRSACRDEQRVGDHFIAPLGSAKRGLLRFTGGAHRVVVRADLLVRGLCRAHFGHRMPMVGVQGGVMTIRYPRAVDDWLDRRSESPAEVALNARIPWDIEVRGGASRLVADLYRLRLGSLDLNGGASRLEMALPIPVGTVAVVINGGANNVTIGRPTGVPARLRVEGGATNLQFDDRSLSAAGGDLDLTSQDYEAAADRYDIAVTGGANNMRIDKQRV